MKTKVLYYSNNKGVVLVLVLWLMVLITVVTIGFSSVTRTETRLIANQVFTSQARAFSQGGIWLGLQLLLTNEADRTWRKDGTPNLINFEDGQIVIRMFDEAGKIDLNSASTELLNGLFSITGTDANKINTIVASLEDWRDLDNAKRLYGAEDEDYFNAGYAYGAKNGPFNSIQELRLIYGMNEKLYQQIAPALTVFSHNSAINPLSASEIALLAIPGIDQETVHSFLNNRKIDNSAEIRSNSAISSRYLSRSNGDVFTISSTGIVGIARYTTNAIIQLRRNAAVPFSILSWTEAAPLSINNEI